MSRRIVINLLAFAALGVVLAVWAVSNVVSIDSIDRPYRVTAEFETSPGLSPYFEVTYLGQPVGAISSVSLGKGVVVVELEIDRGVELPKDLHASVRRKSAVGEPYVDLEIRGGVDPDEGPRLEDGDVIGVENTSTPLAYSDVFESLDALVKAVDPDDLQTLVHELSVGLDGRTESLRQIVTGASDLTGDLAANADLLDALLTDLTTLTNTLAEHRGEIGTGIDNLADLAATLRDSRADIAALLDRGPLFGDQVASLLAASKGDLACTLHGLGTLGSKLDAATVSALSRLLSLSPQFLEVLEGIRDPSGYSRGTLGFNNGTNPPPVYDEQLTLPDPPEVADCPDLASVGQGTGAALGDSGTTPPDDVVDSEPPAVDRGPSDAEDDVASPPVGEGDGLPIVAAGAVLLLLAVAAGLWWVLVGRKRRATTEADV